ncbi:MAG TPA: hypothetical protein VHR88_03545 [Solirubrobacteraceae bacterium]|nr:hypothetical protein [Solirubrobacteraceae bacterium]
MAVDPFVVVILGGVAVIVIFVLLLGRFYPGSGADVLDWKPNHAALETQIENELDDINQMLEAANERRRRRGEPELTERQLRDDVAAEQRALHEQREARLEREEIDQLLALKNERRRAKGQPEITEDEFRASLQGGRAKPDAG